VPLFGEERSGENGSGETAVIVEQANEQFERGLEYYDSGELEKALQAFEESARLYADAGEDYRLDYGYARFWSGLVLGQIDPGERAIRLLEEARVIFEEYELWDDLTVCLNELGLVHVAAGMHLKAIVYYRAALEILGDEEDEESRAIVWENIADLFSDLKEYETELKFRQWVYRYWYSTDDRLETAWAAWNLGLCLDRLNRTEEALTYWEPAVVIFHRQGEFAQSFQTAVRVAAYYENQGVPEKAMKYFSAAFENAQKLGSKADQAVALRGVGEALVELGKYPEAAEAHRRALGIFEDLSRSEEAFIQRILLTKALQKAGDLEGAEKTALDGLAQAEDDRNLYAQIMLLHELGEIHRSLFQLREALEYHRRELTAAEQIGSPDAVTFAIESIADIQIDLGSYDEAFAMLQRGIALAGELTQQYTLHSLLLDRAWLHTERGDVAAAERDAEKARAIAGKLDYKKGEAEALGTLGSVAAAAGRFNDAIEYTEGAIGIFKELNRPGEVATGYNNLGTLLTDMERYPEAESAFNKAKQQSEDLEDKRGIAVAELNLATMYNERSEFRRALETSKKALEFYTELGHAPGIVRSNMVIAASLSDLGRMNEAVLYSDRALDKAKMIGDVSLLANALGNRGVLHAEIGEFRRAASYYENALELVEEKGMPLEIATQQMHLAGIYADLGKFDTALEYAEKAKQIYSHQGLAGSTADALHLIADLYAEWGRYEKGLEFEKQALALRRQLGLKKETAESLNNLGLLLADTGDEEGARTHLDEAMDIFLEIEYPAGIASVHNNIGVLDFEQGDYAAAARHYSKALELVQKVGDKSAIAGVMENVAGAFSAMGRYPDAVELLEKALEINKNTGDKVSAASCHSNIGATYWFLERYREAEDHFLRSIEIKEELRRTAEGAIRRDYLASQIWSYKGLAACRVRLGNFSDAFDAVELASARYLAEQIRGEDGGTGSERTDAYARPVRLREYRSTLPEGTAILNFANTDYWYPICLLATDDTVYGAERDQEKLKTSIIEPFLTEIEMFAPEVLEVMGGVRGVKEGSPNRTLAAVVRYYRSLLTEPHPSSSDRETVRTIAGELYRFLIEPLEDYLDGVETLQIVPHGALAFLPFETLILPDGRYLVEKYDVQYLPSLTVGTILRERDYPGSREPMLAFGGAVYAEDRYERDMAAVRKELEHIEKEAAAAVGGGRSTRAAYERLGLMRWSNLPGTLEEVAQIRKIVPGSVVYTGSKVSEPFVKRLSRTGELTRYRVLHFATHGIVVPEIPELSAVVLSLSKSDTGQEDGFLNAGEILDLELGSDFVNLSACETGLGRLVQGEGVVGLTQSFLVAGTKGISVSLWQVSDVSTAEFMTGLYKEARRDGDYVRAMNEMKRRFIEDPRLHAPFYWAPFVYYGR
jgi:tetratricopeptide (TPR) repeat protein/CHAT domain-containing protein